MHFLSNVWYVTFSYYMRLRQNTTQCKEQAILSFLIRFNYFFIFIHGNVYLFYFISNKEQFIIDSICSKKKKKKEEKLDFILFIVCFLSLPGFDRPFFQIQIFLEEYFFNCLRSIENIRNGRLIRCTDKMHVKKKRIKKAIYEVNLVFLFFFFSFNFRCKIRTVCRLWRNR